MKSKPYFQKQQQNLYQLRKAHQNEYSHFFSVSKSDKFAIQNLKKSVGNANLTKLKDRVWIATNSFGVTGVSLDGIQETADVKDHIKELVDSGVVIRSPGSLKLTHPKMYRR